MKILYFSLLLFICAGTSVEVFSQNSAKQIQAADWSDLFPEIPNCDRTIQPISRNGEVVEQTANYDWANYKGEKNQYYYGCGSITLRYAPNARQSARESSSTLNFPMNVPIRVKTFEAYQSSPMCGNDNWLGSTAVYFDENMALFVTANLNAYKIIEFAQEVDYKLLKKRLNKLARN
jgi:hypothetical protein